MRCIIKLVFLFRDASKFNMFRALQQMMREQKKKERIVIEQPVVDEKRLEILTQVCCSSCVRHIYLVRF